MTPEAHGGDLREELSLPLFPELTTQTAEKVPAPGPSARSRRSRKRYARVWNRQVRKQVALHRQLAAETLGRPLLPGEIVHHRDGDSRNNARENLLVLPSQRFHAHIEYHLRCQKRGMPCLFPELFQRVQEERPSTLWDSIL